ncbi:MAG: holo-ACP synthase [Spirochaetales bacterium]
MGVGTDLVENVRLESWLSQPRLLERYFTETEREDSLTGSHPAASLAARFAAKEAFGKAVGTGLGGLNLRDIETRRDGSGRPRLELGPTARQALARTGATRVHLSLSHEKGYSLAFVIVEE